MITSEASSKNGGDADEALVEDKEQRPGSTPARLAGILDKRGGRDGEDERRDKQEDRTERRGLQVA